MGGATQGGIHVTIHAGTSVQSSSPAKILDWCEKVARLGNRLSPVLFGQNAERRDRSQWCPLHPVRQLDSEIKRAKESGMLSINIGKYAMINFSKLRSTGCIEFRSFATTLNPHKILVILASVFTICQEATTDNLSNWSSQNRLARAKASEMFGKFWNFGGRRYVFGQFPTMKRFAKSMFNWGYASCAYFDRLRLNELPERTERNAEALDLMRQPSFLSHVRGSV
jgi:hypothetical protein